ncbi:hypothetical protein N8603_00295 [Verrucomicrobiales bacterium]|nr:hypothetical protein [Verrucomicrobiales bacterium]
MDNNFAEIKLVPSFKIRPEENLNKKLGTTRVAAIITVREVM